MSFGSIPRPAFGRAAQHLAAETPAPRKVTKADMRYMRAAKLAAELLPELPAKNETVHALMLGTFDLCQVIGATAKLLPDLRHLRIATLCFSKRNVRLLEGLLESRGCVLTLLASKFFRAHNKEGYDASKTALEAFPNTRLAVAKNHCKVVCFDFGKRDGLVFEGSANLRANDSLEQLTVIRNRALHDWHANWIDEFVSKDNGENNEKEAR